jgi:hypothetical protein
MPIKELFLVGFTFSKGFGYRKDSIENTVNILPHWDKHIDPKEAVHNLDKWAVNLREADHKFSEELDWFKSFKDSRIRCDEWMERVLCV